MVGPSVISIRWVCPLITRSYFPLRVSASTSGSSVPWMRAIFLPLNFISFLVIVRINLQFSNSKQYNYTTSSAKGVRSNQNAWYCKKKRHFLLLQFFLCTVIMRTLEWDEVVQNVYKSHKTTEKWAFLAFDKILWPRRLPQKSFKIFAGGVVLRPIPLYTWS